MTDDVLWKPKFLPFKEALVEAATMTNDDLVAAMAEVDDLTRDELAKGPKGRRWDCRVCVAFADLIRLLDDKQAAADLADPRWRVYLYHEVPKAKMTSSGQMHYGPLANEGYARCLQTYRAAGWEGVDATGPNA